MSTNPRLTWHEIKVCLVVVFVAVCGALGVDIHLASMPHLMIYLHTDKTHMQQSVSIFLLGTGASLLFYGPLSDKYGRKPVVIFGLSFACLTSLLAVFSRNIPTFLILRLCQGIGSGVCMGLGRTIIADVLQGPRLAVTASYLALVISLSPLLAPLLGGYLQAQFNWQANFIALSLFLATALILYILYCPETNLHINRQALSAKILLHNYRSLLTHPVFIGGTIISGIGSAITFTYATLSPFILQIQFHLSAIDFGWLTGIAAAGGLMGKLCSPYFIRHWNSKNTILLGLILLLSVGLILVMLTLLHLIQISILLGAAFLAIFGQGCIMPNTVALALSPFPDKRGSAGALYGSFQLLIAFISTAVAGSFAHNGIVVLAAAYCFLGMVGLLAYKLTLVDNSV